MAKTRVAIMNIGREGFSGQGAQNTLAGSWRAILECFPKLETRIFTAQDEKEASSWVGEADSGVVVYLTSRMRGDAQNLASRYRYLQVRHIRIILFTDEPRVDSDEPFEIPKAWVNKELLAAAVLGMRPLRC